MREIALRARDGRVRAYALVDDADFEWLSRWRWFIATRTGYVVRSCGVYMHRLILGLETGDPRQGEHEDRNPLNNQRSNLRIAERGALDNGQNRGLYSNNTSGFRGVAWHKPTRKWLAKVRVDGKQHNLGSFETPEQADAACKAFRAKHMPFSDDARVV